MKKNQILSYFLGLAAVVLLVALIHWRGETLRPNSPRTPQHRVSLMTYNVDNLFDTTHDLGKEDYTFLPLKQKFSSHHTQRCRSLRSPKWRAECLHLDWSEKNLARKMRNLAQVILSVNAGNGPDILVLQEVENIAVLEKLRTQYLATANYLPGILIEGIDPRGIDVAVLTRLPLATIPRAHPDIQRPILQLALRLPNGEILHLLGVHFLAPFHPAKERLAGLQLLAKLQSSLKPRALVIAAGDFNITSSELGRHRHIQQAIGQHWSVAHLQRELNAPGTTFYGPKKKWSFLDMILYSRSVRLNPASIQVINHLPGQQTHEKTPQRFNVRTGQGHSDHWPLYVELELKMQGH